MHSMPMMFLGDRRGIVDAEINSPLLEPQRYHQSKVPDQSWLKEVKTEFACFAYGQQFRLSEQLSCTFSVHSTSFLP